MIEYLIALGISAIVIFGLGLLLVWIAFKLGLLP